MPQVDKDVRSMLVKPDAPKPKLIGCRVWPRAIPQFNIGHLDTLATARSALQVCASSAPCPGLSERQQRLPQPNRTEILCVFLLLRT